MDKIEHIKNSIFKADAYQSKLDLSVLSIPGQTGTKIKHFLNNVVDFEGANHFEIGVNRGATLTSALFKNNVNSSYAIDISNKHNRELLFYRKNLNLSFKFFNCDCFKFDLSKIHHKINVYIFDGDHTYEDHYKSLEYFYPVLDDEFIFLVDDWVTADDNYFNNWKQVQEGTLNSISNLNLKILYESTKPRIAPESVNWWGGYWISLLKK